MRWMCAALAMATSIGCNSVSTEPDRASSGDPVGARIRVPKIDKVDLLFVVDNSPSMADAQKKLARDVPELLASLSDRTPDARTGKPHGIDDIHVGIITSSLGSHGTSICDPATNPHRNDHAHLLPRDGASCGAGVATSSALRWTYGETDTGSFHGEDGRTMLQNSASCVIEAAGDDGCAHPQTWESLYHFLVDPKPYASADVKCTGDDCGSNVITVAGVDEALLAERKAFLRPDSVLAIVILSNENDVSLKPAGLNWIPWAYPTGTMPRGWGGCDAVPDDFEPESAADVDLLHSMYHCRTCFEDGSDPNCKKPWPAAANQDLDARSLRGFEQTRRFGFNFLWGRQRYVQALTNAQALASDGSLGVNSIFAGGFRTRDLVIVETLVGVPEPLVTHGDGSPRELREDEWEKIVGPVGQRDPHMIESIAPRAGVPKFTGDRSIDAMNGGDRDVPDGGALQYACIGKRAIATPTEACASGSNPICEGTDQAYFPAVPGLRHLRIARELGASALVGSICAESYAPALRALSNKIVDTIGDQCVTSEIGVRDGRATCSLFEALADDGGGLTCEQLGKGLCTVGAAPCRVEGSDSPPVGLAEAAARLTMVISVSRPDGLAQSESVQGQVDGANVVVIGSDEKKRLVCEMQQLASDDPSWTACLSDPKFQLDPAVAGGWCYTQDPAVVRRPCTLGTLRFGGGAIPREHAEVFVSCPRE